jgi:hypothetical protein
MIRKFKLAFLILSFFAILILSGCATSNPYIGYGYYKEAPPSGNVGLGGLGYQR